MHKVSAPKFLASVTCLNEAQLVLDANVDIIDLKNPAEGALGALPLETIQVNNINVCIKH